jgi:anti-sigma factor RsiW
MEAARLADLHAYVDDCLEPDERSAFEREMAQDPALARRAALWRGQNSAIRTAFEAGGAAAFPISITRHQSESFGRASRSGVADAKPGGQHPARATLAAAAQAARPSAKDGALDAFRPWLAWRLGLAALSFLLGFVWAPVATFAPGQQLGEAGVAAFQAFVRPGAPPVEFATSDTAEAQAWLTTRLTRPVVLPATPAALKMVGARIAPYPAAPAAFLVYKSQGALLGLLVQSLDAPPTTAPRLLAADGGSAAIWTWGGQGLALVGDLDEAALLKIAADFADLPAEAAQPMPERGW